MQAFQDELDTRIVQVKELYETLDAIRRLLASCDSEYCAPRQSSFVEMAFAQRLPQSVIVTCLLLLDIQPRNANRKRLQLEPINFEHLPHTIRRSFSHRNCDPGHENMKVWASRKLRQMTPKYLNSRDASGVRSYIIAEIDCWWLSPVVLVYYPGDRTK